MAKYLVTRCKSCNEALEAVHIDRFSSSKLGEAIKQAASSENNVEIRDQVELGHCSCVVESNLSNLPAEKSATKSRSSKFGWSIRQLMFLTAIAAVFTAVFRNPVLMLFGGKDAALAYLPWHFYFWLFLGAPMPVVKKGPPAGVDIFLLCINFFLAAMATVYVLHYSIRAIRYGWRKVSE